ncbi:hypothetical protein BKA93DRAFT_316896 [Sparassis latifolia]
MDMDIGIRIRHRHSERRWRPRRDATWTKGRPPGPSCINSEKSPNAPFERCDRHSHSDTPIVKRQVRAERRKGRFGSPRAHHRHPRETRQRVGAKRTRQSCFCAVRVALMDSEVDQDTSPGFNIQHSIVNFQTRIRVWRAGPSLGGREERERPLATTAHQRHSKWPNPSVHARRVSDATPNSLLPATSQAGGPGLVSCNRERRARRHPPGAITHQLREVAQRAVANGRCARSGGRGTLGSPRGPPTTHHAYSSERGETGRHRRAFEFRARTRTPQAGGPGISTYTQCIRRRVSPRARRKPGSGARREELSRRPPPRRCAGVKRT